MLEWPNLGTIEIILHMAISIADSIAIDIRLLLAIKKLFHLLLCSIHSNHNLSAAYPIQTLSPQHVPSLFHAKLPMQQQQAELEHFKQINFRMIITWDSQRRAQISLSGFVLQNYSVDTIKPD